MKFCLWTPKWELESFENMFCIGSEQTTVLHTHEFLLCWCSKMESDRVQWGKYVQSDIPDTSDVNMTLFCAAT